MIFSTLYVANSADAVEEARYALGKWDDSFTTNYGNFTLFTAIG